MARKKQKFHSPYLEFIKEILQSKTIRARVLLSFSRTLWLKKGIEASEYFHYTFRNYRNRTREVYEGLNSYWCTIVGNWKTNLLVLIDEELEKQHCHPYEEIAYDDEGNVVIICEIRKKDQQSYLPSFNMRQSNLVQNYA